LELIEVSKQKGSSKAKSLSIIERKKLMMALSNALTQIEAKVKTFRIKTWFVNLNEDEELDLWREICVKLHVEEFDITALKDPKKIGEFRKGLKIVKFHFDHIEQADILFVRQFSGSLRELIIHYDYKLQKIDNYEALVL
jgi:hypothetical protein